MRLPKLDMSKVTLTGDHDLVAQIDNGTFFLDKRALITSLEEIGYLVIVHRKNNRYFGELFSPFGRFITRTFPFYDQALSRGLQIALTLCNKT